MEKITLFFIDEDGTVYGNVRNVNGLIDINNKKEYMEEKTEIYRDPDIIQIICDVDTTATIKKKWDFIAWNG